MKYKEKDKVLICSLNSYEKEVMRWLNDDRLSYFGTVMTISKVEKDHYRMKEDNGKHLWRESWIVEKVKEDSKQSCHCSKKDLFYTMLRELNREEAWTLFEYAVKESLSTLNQYRKCATRAVENTLGMNLADLQIISQFIIYILNQNNDSLIEKRIAAWDESLKNDFSLKSTVKDKEKDKETVQIVTGKYTINGESYQWINPNKLPVELGGIVFADTEKGCRPIIVTNITSVFIDEVPECREIVGGVGV